VKPGVNLWSRAFIYNRPTTEWERETFSGLLVCLKWSGLWALPQTLLLEHTVAVWRLEKMCVKISLENVQKVTEWMESGRLFHTRAAGTPNAWLLTLWSRVHGTRALILFCAPWFSSETLALCKSLTYLLTYLLSACVQSCCRQPSWGLFARNAGTGLLREQKISSHFCLFERNSVK